MFLCRRSADSGGGIGYVPPFETNIEMDSWEYLSRSHLSLRLRLRLRLHNYAQSLTPTLTPMFTQHIHAYTH
ncbi:hypothetical protein RclHR1_00490025 [Rhizophagus clarus]|uniref:Uncharacterized protein n=1 Tax=Rhizophagus clarus TaxID=94130 RepID=A0A2Z6SDK3_9GLOM|nr:hypothetical protein RclHR1_00490025 [Rhizophagus clarus]GES80622.1 hypothetical protein RCL_e19782_RclHR1_00490025 [Rhizophagus clarus]